MEKTEHLPWCVDDDRLDYVATRIRPGSCPYFLMLRCRHAIHLGGGIGFVKAEQMFHIRGGSGRIKGDHLPFLQSIEDLDHFRRVLADCDHAAFQRFIMGDEADLLPTVGADGLMRDRQHVSALREPEIDHRRSYPA